MRLGYGGGWMTDGHTSDFTTDVEGVTLPVSRLSLYLCLIMSLVVVPLLLYYCCVVFSLELSLLCFDACLVFPFFPSFFCFLMRRIPSVSTSSVVMMIMSK